MITEVTKLRKNISEKEETIKVEKTEINKLNLEMVALENDKSKLWLQLNVVKQEAHREALNNYFPCTNCSFKTKRKSEIKVHNSENHQHHKQSQVEECSSQDSIEPLVPQFLEYPCFYCRKKILSADQVEEHREHCQEKKYDDQHSCEVCKAECKDEGDLARHRTAYHQLGTWSGTQSKEIYWCNVCPLTYERLDQLEFHKRGFHWNV